MPDEPNNTVLDQINAGASETTINVDFDLDTIKAILDEIIGEGAGDEIIGTVAADVTSRLGPDNGTGEDWVKQPENLSGVFSRVAQVVATRNGPRTMRQVIGRASSWRMGERVVEEMPIIPPAPRPSPASGQDRLTQLNNISEYFAHTFQNDRQMRRILELAYEKVLGASGVPLDTSGGGLTGGLGPTLDPAQIPAVGVQLDAVSTETFVQVVKDIMAEEEESGSLQSRPGIAAETSSLLDAMEREWVTGRSDLPADHPDRDPSGVITPVEKENRSPRLRNLLPQGEEPIETRELQFVDPLAARGFDDFNAQTQASFQALVDSAAFQALPPLDRQTAMDQWFSDNRTQAANIMWETSILGNEFSPDDIAITQEAFTKDFLTQQSEIFKNQLQVKDNSFALGDAGSLGVFDGLNDAGKDYVGSLSRQTGQFANQNLPNGQKKVTLGELQDYYLEMNDADFRQFQLNQFLAGAYADVPPDQIPFGDKEDPIAWDRWNQEIATSARLANRGEFVSIETIMDRAIHNSEASERAFLRSQREDAAGDLNDARKLASGSLSAIIAPDPRTIVDSADTIAQDLLGRNASPEERRLLIGVVSRLSLENQTAKARATAGQAANQLQAQAEAELNRIDRLEDDLNFNRAQGEIRSGLPTDQTIRERVEDPSAGAQVGEFPQLQIREQQLGDARQEFNQSDPNSDPLRELVESGELAGGGGLNITQIQDFDAKAYVRDYLAENNAGEVQAHELRQGFGTFLAALQSPIGV